MEQIGMADYFCQVCEDETHRKALRAFIANYESKRTKLLWDIFFGTDISDLDTLEERIYIYGNKLRESDYVGRELFPLMVTFLNFMKMEREGITL